MNEEIDYKIMDLMIEFGPDGHCDGHEKITEYVVSLIESAKQEVLKEIQKLAKDTLTEDPTKKEWVEGYTPWEIEPCYECDNSTKIKKFLDLLESLKEEKVRN